MKRDTPLIDRVARLLLLLFGLDRALKLCAIEHFFRRPLPPAPSHWPTVTLLQPLTRGAADLPAALTARAQLDYPARVQHLWVCDAHDVETRAGCAQVLADFPQLWAEVVPVHTPDDALAVKTVKLHAGLAHASGDVICCVDDDVILRPMALRILIPYVLQPGTGAAFGIACYVRWQNVPSSLMSMFVNANALLSYIPLTYLADPFTITGHCFVLRREMLDAVGGFAGLEQRIDDDHDLARRIRALQLSAVQTPLVYDVANDFASLGAYARQIKRWFVFPREALLPLLTRRERTVSALGSAANMIPSLLAVLALLTRSRKVARTVVDALLVYGLTYALCETRYLGRRTPLRRWLLLPVVALVTPIQIVVALLGNGEVEWRGQRLRIRRGGTLEVQQ